MTSSMHAQRVCSGEINALDLRRRNQSRNVLGVRPPPHAFTQIVGDAASDRFIGQRPAVMLAIEPDDMEAVARDDRLRTQFAGP